MSICPAKLSSCRCSKPNGHDGPHTCTDPSTFTPSGRCHGQWHHDGRLVQYPTGAWTEEEALEHMGLIRRGEPLPAVVDGEPDQ